MPATLKRRFYGRHHVSWKRTTLSCTLPINVNLKIEFTEPGEKGNTYKCTKLATTETGAEIKVHAINQGDTKTDTINGNYLERVKE